MDKVLAFLKALKFTEQTVKHTLSSDSEHLYLDLEVRLALDFAGDYEKVLAEVIAAALAMGNFLPSLAPSATSVPTPPQV